MALAADQIVELCCLNAAVLREDISLMKARTVIVQIYRTDVTNEFVARMEANIARLEIIIDDLKCPDGSSPSSSSD